MQNWFRVTMLWCCFLFQASASEGIDGFVGYTNSNQHVTESGVYYGLNLSATRGPVAAHIFISPKVNASPEVSILQLTLSESWFRLHVGRIYTTIGFYDQPRITPAANFSNVPSRTMFVGQLIDKLSRSDIGFSLDIEVQGIELRYSLYQPRARTLEESVTVFALGGVQPVEIAMQLGVPLIDVLGIDLTSQLGEERTIETRDTETAQYFSLSYFAGNWGVSTSIAQLDSPEVDFDVRSFNIERYAPSYTAGLEYLKIGGTEVVGGALSIEYPSLDWISTISVLTGTAQGLEVTSGVAFNFLDLDWRVVYRYVKAELSEFDQTLRSSAIEAAVTYRFGYP